MKTMLILFSLASAAVIPASSLAETVTFDNALSGYPPPGWNATQTGKGSAKWTVEPDPTAPSPPNVLKQSGQASYPLCIINGSSFKDGFVEVKFKPVSGKTDQAAGLIWRCRDADNYYVARANALEDNVTIYRTVRGKRVAFQNVNTKVTPAQWHTLRVDFQANKFIVTFDGKQVIEATDDTFARPGKVGLWTKADSLTLFDNFTFAPK